MTMDYDDGIDLPVDEKNDYYTDDDLFKISSWGADLSFRELISRYDEDELVKPELQRNYVWDKNEASRFIDSVLLNLPVPSIFLAKTQDEKLLIIDGFQRIMTVYDYVKGVFSKDKSVFKLTRSEKIHERWRGKAFVELSDDEQRRIKNTTIHAIIFMQKHPAKGDTSLFQVFERINTSGRTLLPQEIRNCVYQGRFNSLLFELNNNSTWRSLWGSVHPDERMRDLECILRFFALSDDAIVRNEIRVQRISLKKYLNQYMEKVNDNDSLDPFRDRFIKAVEFVYQSFGLNAFHNISNSDDGKFVESFNSTVFDSVMISVDIAMNDERVDMSVDGFEGKRINLLRDANFQKLLSEETMRVANIRKRVGDMYGALFGIKLYE